MTAVMEKKIKPALQTSNGLDFKGEGKGSSELAQEIKSHLATPDIFISAAPSVNRKLLMGSANGNYVSWYMTLAADQLVLAYSPQSRFASSLQAAAKGTLPWYQVLLKPGFLFGRTDPLLDPKGADTIIMMKLAQAYYHQPNLATKILKSDENPKQVFPEESLLAQLTSGQLDAIVAYKHEAVEWGVPYITLPNAINLGDAADAAMYKTASYTAKGKVENGSPIVFTITIPSTVKNTAGAQTFVEYMLTGEGHHILMNDGFSPIHEAVYGNQSALPAGLKNLLNP